MSLIPKEPRKAKPNSPPAFMLIMGPPKIGTTEALLQLPNSLHIDLQEGAKHYSSKGLVIDVVGIEKRAKINITAAEGQASHRNFYHKYEVLLRVLADLEDRKIKGEPLFDFIILDPASSLEEIVNDRALELYKNSAYAKADAANDHTRYVKFDVGWNKGVEMLQSAFEETVNSFRNYCNTLIIKVHGKDSTSTKLGKEVTMETLDISKQIAGWLAKESDSICHMYRAESNINKLSFVKTTSNELLGSRSSHLNNKIFNLSQKKDETSPLVTNWSAIFPHIKNGPEEIKEDLSEKNAEPKEEKEAPKEKKKQLI